MKQKIQITAPKITSPKIYFSIIKLTKTKKKLELHQKRIKYLALNFDPFNPQLSSEIERIFQFYKISFLEISAFEWTNQILEILDWLEHQLKETSH